MCSSINPDAIEPGSQPAGLNLLPEKKRIDFLEFHPQIISQQPDLDTTIDFNPTSDFDFGLDSYSSLSFPDEASSTAPTANNTSYLQYSDCLSFDHSTPLFPQTLSSSNSSLNTRPSKPSPSCPSLTLSHAPSELQPSIPGSSLMPLPRLSHLKCPYCPRLCLNGNRLR